MPSRHTHRFGASRHLTLTRICLLAKVLRKPAKQVRRRLQGPDTRHSVRLMVRALALARHACRRDRCIDLTSHVCCRRAPPTPNHRYLTLMMIDDPVSLDTGVIWLCFQRLLAILISELRHFAGEVLHSQVAKTHSQEEAIPNSDSEF